MDYYLSMPQFRECLIKKKLQSKPWITKAILTSINAKNKIYMENIVEPKIKTQKKNYTTPLNFFVLNK